MMATLAFNELIIEVSMNSSLKATRFSVPTENKEILRINFIQFLEKK